MEEVLVKRNGTYLDRERFNYHVYNMGLKRERAINDIREQLLIIRLLKIILFVFTSLFAIISILLLLTFVKNVSNNLEIISLKKSLETEKSNNVALTKLLNEKIDLDYVKEKAYLELDMIKPTEKSIIYFDSTGNLD